MHALAILDPIDIVPRHFVRIRVWQRLIPLIAFQFEIRENSREYLWPMRTTTGMYNISALFALEMEEIWNFHVEISFLLFVLHFESNFSIRREGISMKFRKKKKKFFVNIWISIVRTIDCDVYLHVSKIFFDEILPFLILWNFDLAGLLFENFREISFNFACLVIFYYNRACVYEFIVSSIS